ncbi:phosphoglucosamine mutase [Halococcus saccharolyticus]|uniref:Phosphoglucosamine mutase n=1 Tax=Halococcus saccharolyticus DSM 5350 TaxID=1227455 RepID=M0MFK6_9EURY|nr:phosphoglucosamine mutase [Halococcus saccharolyticus]EMA44492.1 phosphoglucosamine mutase [Halococcus saccharolyticus DSM 5350]
MELFGSSGIRGVANETVTPSFCLRVGMAVGTVVGGERVAVGRDTRATGGMFANAVVSGLQSVGCDVDRLGALPTPGVQLYAERESVPAVMITASHNPPEYNGIKLVGADGIELPVAELERIETALDEDGFARARWDETGDARSIEGVREAYVEEVVDAVDRDRIADADLTVALDPGHGAGALTSPKIFRELGCSVVTVNAQADSHFPGRDPEPVPENLGDLGRLVRAADADVGIAHDGDADRAIFFDERGEYIEGDATFAVLAAGVLDADATTVSAVTASQRLVDVADRANATLERTPVGSTQIISRVRDLESEGRSVPVAGEGNGGVLFPNYRLARDGAYTAARFLELLVDRPASEIVADVGDYHNVRTTVDYESDAEREALLATVARHAEASPGELDTTDGYRLDFGDAWVLARESGTEPVVRIYAEAREASRAHDLADDLETALEAALADA